MKGDNWTGPVSVSHEPQVGELLEIQQPDETTDSWIIIK
jgi:hypothetical protein